MQNQIVAVKDYVKQDITNNQAAIMPDGCGLDVDGIAEDVLIEFPHFSLSKVAALELVQEALEEMADAVASRYNF